MTQPWHVLVIAGASGTGKTEASLALAARHGVSVTRLDDVSIAVRRMTTPEHQPALHYWWTHPEAGEWPAERILDLTLAFGEAMAPALEAVLADRLDEPLGAVMEGDWVLPAMAALPALAGAVANGRLRFVFLHEPDEQQLRENLSRREPGHDHTKRARVSWLYGRWLAEEARRHGLTALSVRPWETQLERIAAAIG